MASRLARPVKRRDRRSEPTDENSMKAKSLCHSILLLFSSPTTGTGTAGLSVMPAVLISLLLAGCGGGSSSSSPDPVPLPSLQTNAALKSVSYDNAKGVGLVPGHLPPGTRAGAIRAYGDFFGNGRLDLFVAALTYSPNTSTPTTATLATFKFWRRELDGSFTSVPIALPGVQPCIHPRKVLVADFNADGRPDLVVSCTGYDGAPFPGERSKLVLSTSAGGYELRDFSSDVDYRHGAAVADFDGDGRPDLVFTSTVFGGMGPVYLNKGNGVFIKESFNRFPAAIQGKIYFEIEVLDVDGDGKADVVFGGHEWTDQIGGGVSPTVVLLNPGNGDFRNVTPIVLPPIAGDAVVLDFTVIGIGATRALAILRTSGGDGTFYQGRTYQKVIWPSLVSSTLYANRATPWTEYVYPAVIGGVPSLVSDDDLDGVIVPQ